MPIIIIIWLLILTTVGPNTKLFLSFYIKMNRNLSNTMFTRKFIVDRNKKLVFNCNWNKIAGGNEHCGPKSAKKVKNTSKTCWSNQQTKKVNHSECRIDLGKLVFILIRYDNDPVFFHCDPWSNCCQINNNCKECDDNRNRGNQSIWPRIQAIEPKKHCQNCPADSDHNVLKEKKCFCSWQPSRSVNPCPKHCTHSITSFTSFSCF